MDQRPAIAAALRALQAGAGPQWVTLGGERLRLDVLTEALWEHGEGPVLLRTRRGYRRALLSGRDHRTGHLRDEHHRTVPERQLCAAVLEVHPREG